MASIFPGHGVNFCELGEKLAAWSHGKVPSTRLLVVAGPDQWWFVPILGQRFDFAQFSGAQLQAVQQLLNRR